MNAKNIDLLATRLEALGAGPAIKQRLAAFACFNAAEFDIRCAVHIPDGTCEFVLHCVKGDQGLYDALYYTATLKRRPAAPAALEALDQSLGSINWVRLLTAREQVVEGAERDAIEAAAVLQGIGDTDTDGIVRFRHWAGTAIETTIPNLASIKSQHELSQRFYLVPDQPPIRFEEACRFLQSRWMEKRINADRKLLDKKSQSEKGGSQPKGGKLLPKRTKANRKPGLFDR